MKLIRLTDDRYILDAGPDLTQERAEQISQYFVDWWRRDHTVVPRVVIVGGSEIPLEYEDRREPDIEARLEFLENHTHVVAQSDQHRTIRSGAPVKGEKHGEVEEGQD